MIINSVHFSMLGTNRVEQQASSYCLNILTKQFFANFTLGKEKEHMPNWPEIEGGGGGGMPAAFLSTSASVLGCSGAAVRAWSPSSSLANERRRGWGRGRLQPEGR